MLQSKELFRGYSTIRKTLDRSPYNWYGIEHQNTMDTYSRNTDTSFAHEPAPVRPTHTGDIATALFRPKMLLALVFVWVLTVAVGSSVAIYATQYTMLSDDEVEAMLSETERLAENVNVDYRPQPPREVQEPTIPVYPERLVIPRLGKELPVSNPQTRNIAALDEELKRAVVRYPDAATLGQKDGNTLIFGHSSRLPVVRNKLYQAFNDIETLQEGDTVEAYAGDDVYTYKVTRVYEASAESDRIPLVTNGHQLTLLTCDTFGKKSDRFVVEAKFIGKNI